MKVEIAASIPIDLNDNITPLKTGSSPLFEVIEESDWVHLQNLELLYFYFVDWMSSVFNLQSKKKKNLQSIEVRLYLGACLVTSVEKSLVPIFEIVSPLSTLNINVKEILKLKEMGGSTSSE